MFCRSSVRIETALFIILIHEIMLPYPWPVISFNDVTLPKGQEIFLIFLWPSWSCEVKYWHCLFQVVDQKKLQKAEAKIKAKQDKRAQEDQTPNEIRGRCDDGIYKFLF